MFKDKSTLPDPSNIRADSIMSSLSAMDEQHAVLDSLAKRLLDHPEALARDELVVDILTDLGKFLILHFQTEEALMRQLDMPKEVFEAHVRAHNVIIDEYAELNMAAARGRNHTVTEIFCLFRAWIEDHLRTHDTKIRDYVPAPSPD